MLVEEDTRIDVVGAGATAFRTTGAFVLVAVGVGVGTAFRCTTFFVATG